MSPLELNTVQIFAVDQVSLDLINLGVNLVAEISDLIIKNQLTYFRSNSVLKLETIRFCLYVAQYRVLSHLKLKTFPAPCTCSRHKANL